MVSVSIYHSTCTLLSLCLLRLTFGLVKCTSVPLRGGLDDPTSPQVHMMSQKQQRIYLQDFLSLSHILLLPRRKPYFSSAVSLRETTKLLPGGEVERGRFVCVCEGDGDVLPPVIPPPPMSVCEGPEAAV